VTATNVISWTLDNYELVQPIAVGVLTLLVMGLLWIAVQMNERGW
jgi:hypothetical protein